jgi:hypothetical protein
MARGHREHGLRALPLRAVSPRFILRFRYYFIHLNKIVCSAGPATRGLITSTVHYSTSLTSGLAQMNSSRQTGTLYTGDVIKPRSMGSSSYRTRVERPGASNGLMGAWAKHVRALAHGCGAYTRWRIGRSAVGALRSDRGWRRLCASRSTGRTWTCHCRLPGHHEQTVWRFKTWTCHCRASVDR